MHIDHERFSVAEGGMRPAWQCFLAAVSWLVLGNFHCVKYLPRTLNPNIAPTPSGDGCFLGKKCFVIQRTSQESVGNFQYSGAPSLRLALPNETLTIDDFVYAS